MGRTPAENAEGAERGIDRLPQAGRKRHRASAGGSPDLVGKADTYSDDLKFEPVRKGAFIQIPSRYRPVSALASQSTFWTAPRVRAACAMIQSGNLVPRLRVSHGMGIRREGYRPAGLRHARFRHLR